MRLRFQFTVMILPTAKVELRSLPKQLLKDLVRVGVDDRFKLPVSLQKPPPAFGELRAAAALAAGARGEQGKAWRFLGLAVSYS